MALRKGFWTVFNLLISVGLIVAAYFAINYHQEIWDWWRLQSYKPPANIAQLAKNTTMVGRGIETFYVSEPEVLGRDTFGKKCTNHQEESSILGCYTMQKIYIFDVEDKQLNGVEEVTAAHEMLHAAYERLKPDAKSDVDKLLQAQMEQLQNDEHLNELIKIYEKSEPGQLLNEMHSILGAEYRNLSPELEKYYKQYFTNRHKIVAYAENYQAVFDSSKQRMAELSAQIEQIKKQIDTNSTILDQQLAELNQQSQELDRLRQQDTEAYNQAVPAYNQQANQYNNLAATTRDLVNQYNGLVAEHNNEAAAQNELYQSLDSKYQPVKAD